MLCLTTDTILVHQSSITSACNEIKPDELLGQRGKATESKGPASIGFSPDTVNLMLQVTIQTCLENNINSFLILQTLPETIHLLQTVYCINSGFFSPPADNPPTPGFPRCAAPDPRTPGRPGTRTESCCSTEPTYLQTDLGISSFESTLFPTQFTMCRLF